MYFPYAVRNSHTPLLFIIFLSTTEFSSYNSFDMCVHKIKNLDHMLLLFVRPSVHPFKNREKVPAWINFHNIYWLIFFENMPKKFKCVTYEKETHHSS